MLRASRRGRPRHQSWLTRDDFVAAHLETFPAFDDTGHGLGQDPSLEGGLGRRPLCHQPARGAAAGWLGRRPSGCHAGVLSGERRPGAEEPGTEDDPLQCGDGHESSEAPGDDCRVGG